MGTNKYDSLLDRSADPETFVREALSLLEMDFREASLLALADWDNLHISSPLLFSTIAELQRPSWGHWNGLLAALRSTRNKALRESDAEVRSSIENAATLNEVLAFLDKRIDKHFIEDLRPLSLITHTILGITSRVGTSLSMAITLRNRLAHDPPINQEEWLKAAGALKPLITYYAANYPFISTASYPSPWFLVEENSVWSYNGLEKDLSARYVAPGLPTRHSDQNGRDIVIAFQRLLGKEGIKENDFRKLLARLAPEEIKGVLIDNYLVGKPVGSGGFATVHVGHQLSTGRKVAVKILHDGMPEETQLRFKREASFLSRLDHPNIVTVIEQGEGTWTAPRSFSLSEEDWFKKFSRSALLKAYISMEWVEGETLDTKWEFKKGIPIEILVDWFAQAADAIATIHAAGLIHRDIKPANVMITEDGQLKIMDLGIARSQNENRTLVTLTGQSLGTLAYMSPEQIRAVDAEAEIGSATDIYSLCATFYELFTGVRLFNHDTKTIGEVRHAKLSGEMPARPQSIIRDIPWEIEAILLGGLQPEVKDRYQSINDLRRDLRRYRNNESILYRRPSIYRRAQLGYKRNRSIVNIVTAFLILIIFGLTSYIQSIKAEQAKTVAERNRAEANAEEARREKATADMQRRRAEENEEEAVRQKKEAENQREAARKNELLARTQRTIAEEQRKAARKNEIAAKRQLAESLISKGDAQGLAHRQPEAKASFDEANKHLSELGDPTFFSDLGLWELYHRSPPALNTLVGHEGGAISLAFSTDGHIALTGDDKGIIKFWDVSLGLEVHKIQAHDGTVTDLAFLPDGKRFVSGGSDQTFKLWDLESKQLIRTFKGPPSKSIGEKEAKKQSNVFNVGISPNGQSILSGDYDGDLILWNLENGQQVKSFKGHTSTIKSAQFSPDGRLALTASWDGEVKVWNTQTWTQTRVFKDHAFSINDAVFSSDGKKILSVGIDKVIREWDVETGNTIRLFFGHTGHINCVAFSPDDTLIISGGEDNVVKVWDEETGRELRSFYGHGRFIFDVGISPDGQLAMSVSGDGKVSLWNLASEPELRSSQRDLSKRLTSIAVSRDGRLALFGSQPSSLISASSPDNSMKLYDLATMEELRSFEGHSEPVLCVAFSPDGLLALSGSWDNTLKIWDIVTGKVVKVLTGHTSGVWSVAYSPDGNIAVSASSDGTVKLWDTANGVEIYSFTGHKGRVQCVAFSPDGKYVVSGGEDQTLKVWDVQAKRLVRSFVGHTEDIRGVAFSPVEKIIVSGGGDETLRFWDLLTGQNTLTISHDQVVVTGLSFSPDGRLVATSANDGQLRLWEVRTGRLLRTFYDPEIKNQAADYLVGLAISVTFSSDGRQLISSNWDGTIKVFDFSLPALHRGFEPKLIAAREALKANSNDAESLNIMGEWLALRGQHQRAVDLLSRARKLGAEKISSLTLARCYLELGESERAKEEYELALKRGESSELYTRLCINGIDWGRQSFNKRVDKYIEESTLEIEKNPKNAEAYQKRAIAYMARQEIEKAYNDFKKAFRLNPDLEPLSDMGIYLRAEYRFEIGNIEGALSDLNRMIKQKPHAAAYNLRGAILRAKGDPNAAIEDFTRAIEIARDFVKPYHNRISIYLDSHEWDKAIADLTEVLRIQPDDEDALLVRGNVRMQVGNVSGALADCGRIVELNPKSAEGFGCRGFAHYKNGKLDLAIGDFVEAIRINPKDPLHQYNIACLYSLRSETHPKGDSSAAARENDIKLAFQHLEQAVANGYKDWKHMDEDTDLNPLRNDPRFKQLRKGR